MKTAIQSRISTADAKRLVRIKKDLARLSASAKIIADESGSSRREIALAMGNASPSTLQRLLAGAAYNATLDTVARFAWACGYELRASFVKRGESEATYTEGVARAEICTVYNFSQYAESARRGAGGWLSTQANADFTDVPSPSPGPVLRSSHG